MRVVRVAAIQTGNHFQDQAAGRTEAEGLIRAAVAEGAELVVLPELSSCGYIPNQSIWQYAEPRDGPTAQWASALSAGLGVFVGAGFTETDGRDFYNSYLLSDPQGEIRGVIRKEDAESYCFKRAPGDTHIDTALGRIGIGICADNHYADRLRRMQAAGVDLMLMPHANPLPHTTSRVVSAADKRELEGKPLLVAATYSRCLNVPTVYVNPVGSYPQFAGGVWMRSYNESFRLRGGSLATTATGELISRLGEEVGYRVYALEVGQQGGEECTPPVYHGKWLHDGNWLYRRLILPHVTRQGVRSYERQHMRYMAQHPLSRADPLPPARLGA